VRVSCPPHRTRVYDGTSRPQQAHGANHSVDEIRKYLNADSLPTSRSPAWFRRPAWQGSVLHACYDGDYRCLTIRRRTSHVMERRRPRGRLRGAQTKEEMQIKLL